MLFVTTVVEGEINLTVLDFFAQKTTFLDKFRLVATTLSKWASWRMRTYRVVVVFYFIEKWLWSILLSFGVHLGHQRNEVVYKLNLSRFFGAFFIFSFNVELVRRKHELIYLALRENLRSLQIADSIFLRWWLYLVWCYWRPSHKIFTIKHLNFLNLFWNLFIFQIEQPIKLSGTHFRNQVYVYLFLFFQILVCDVCLQCLLGYIQLRLFILKIKT